MVGSCTLLYTLAVVGCGVYLGLGLEFSAKFHQEVEDFFVALEGSEVERRIAPLRLDLTTVWKV